MEPDDQDLKDSYYLHIMRSLGAALRHELAVTEPLPDRIEGLLRQLDEPGGVAPVRQHTDNNA
jgi:hypothetical protein